MQDYGKGKKINVTKGVLCLKDFDKLRRRKKEEVLELRV